MVDISARSAKSSPPDRRLLSQLTNDPKVVRYFEDLSSDAASITPGNIEMLLQLIGDVGEVAFSAQGTANQINTALEDLRGAIDLLSRGPSSADVARIDQLVQSLESLILDYGRPIIPANFQFAPSVVTVTGAYTAASLPPYQPLTVRANAGAAAFTVTLPASPAVLQLVNVKKIDATANVVTISAGANTIDGSTTKAVASQYTNIQVQFNGTTWDVL